MVLNPSPGGEEGKRISINAPTSYIAIVIVIIYILIGFSKRLIDFHLLRKNLLSRNVRPIPIV